MSSFRVIPVLLYKRSGLYKSVKFKDNIYIGDPINAVKIFNDKEVDELIFLDIDAYNNPAGPDLDIIKEIASECFMPVCYGGGISSMDQIRTILQLGIEKVSLNRAAVLQPSLVAEASREFGASTIVISMDVKKSFWGKYEVYIENGKKNSKLEAIEFAKKMEDLGAGELLVNSIEKDGTMTGYDLDIISKLASQITIPVVACGGAGNLTDLREAVKTAGASAVAAGSMFVFHGKHKAVLINYPTSADLKKLFL